MRTDGVTTSSNCPFFAARTNAMRNPIATSRLAPTRMKIALKALELMMTQNYFRAFAVRMTSLKLKYDFCQ
jgi:hypothetical protein